MTKIRRRADRHGQLLARRDDDDADTASQPSLTLLPLIPAAEYLLDVLASATSRCWQGKRLVLASAFTDACLRAYELALKLLLPCIENAELHDDRRHVR